MFLPALFPPFCEHKSRTVDDEAILGSEAVMKHQFPKCLPPFEQWHVPSVLDLFILPGLSAAVLWELTLVA